MIRHILADGREVESVEGFVVPPTGPTAAVYSIVVEFAKNHKDIKKNKEEVIAYGSRSMGNADKQGVG